ncbi:MAG: 50S ribosomal protein L17 [Candidatus Spechtbacteria bacterium RIFCSPHIGHO2_02_FULL_43_15b]|uniref:Large ribosomal subunit protein bL17 n=1 Tax=Candidatus Spechtbacteria bacterium RIFCSPHIGHO2_01_FULL_43_30 TaxID=1802158 RepID=A0A1G2H702_9BACT|nr:MAG: 50S ribosomal protein L17 [Candidatus Spechtbacteria bacterium RIFCSPHIGHO2_01_FULL_43_30]OGZ59405.1 MAG: 50S ribosomal protein L17 [Candidatus Spechtbacteria bacterium RIFCSPHIGHO2_02_FULL_43_15b]
MNKQTQGRKFGRERDQRRALLKSLARALILHGKIETTEAKAKELRVFIEPIITGSKANTIHKRRLISKRLGPDTVKKLFSEIREKYSDRKGGYTRITKVGSRRGDSARMAVIELV